MKIIPFVSRLIKIEPDPKITKQAIEIVPHLTKDGRQIKNLFPPDVTEELAGQKAYLQDSRYRSKDAALGYIGTTVFFLALNFSGLTNIPKWVQGVPLISGALGALMSMSAVAKKRALDTLEESIKGATFSVLGRDGKTFILPRIPNVVSEESFPTYSDFQIASSKKMKELSTQLNGDYFLAGTDLTHYRVALKPGESRTYEIPGFGKITLGPGEKTDAFAGEWEKIVPSGNTIPPTEEEAIQLLENPVIAGATGWDFNSADLKAFDERLNESTNTLKSLDTHI